MRDQSLMICFRLAEVLKQDIGDVLNWPTEKVRWWVAYFEAKERIRDDHKKR
jgi:hypothetical protein